MTRNQCRTWLDSETLWAHALTHGADSSELVHNNSGMVLYSQGKYEEAAAHFATALNLNPDVADIHYNLGMVLCRQTRFAEAAAQFAEAVRLNPRHANARNNLAYLLSRRGRYEKAAAEAKRPYRQWPLQQAPTASRP